MKKIMLLFFVPILISCKNSTVTYTDYYQNGNKKMEVSYLNGKLEGLYIMWFENGAKQLETHFKNDSIVGNFIMWHSNGQMANEVNFDNRTENKTVDLEGSRFRISIMEKKIIYGWLKYEAEKLRDKIKQESLTYHRIKCLLFNTLV